MDGGNADVESLRNFGVGPARSVNISLQKNPGPQDLIRRHPFAGEQVLQRLSFHVVQTNDELSFLAHCSLLLKNS
jgi:hypothetical protein